MRIPRQSSYVFLAWLISIIVPITLLPTRHASAQLTDQTQTPNFAQEGIWLSLEQEIGRGRGNEFTANTSIYLIKRDPFRAIRRGRQLFQRKFTDAQGIGPRTQDGVGDIETIPILGAGLADSCSLCHGRPRGSAGFGGNVATQPDSRDAPHLFGLGLVEMLADEITRDLRAIRRQALKDAKSQGVPVTLFLESKGIQYGAITALPDGTVETLDVEGVDPDLRVRPFFAQGGTISLREFIVGAFNAEMGIRSEDPCLEVASKGRRCVTPAGMVLDGRTDTIEAPPVTENSRRGRRRERGELDPAVVDFMEFYLLNYFKPGLGEQTAAVERGFAAMDDTGCTECHVRDLTIEHDRRVADVQTAFDPVNGIFNRLFATATPQYVEVSDRRSKLPQLLPAGEPFVVENIFADFKRHDLGPDFHELRFDGNFRTHFMTEPLWGVGSTSPYGHDGRSINLQEVILRHGGEAAESRDAYAALGENAQRDILDALNSLILFPPDDTASNLNPGDPLDPDFPQYGHGNINLGTLFTTPGPE